VTKIPASAIGGAAVFLAFFGSPPANAVDEFKGQTYDKAAAMIQSWGYKPTIASRQGSYLPTEKCVVTGSRNTSSGNGKPLFLLDLNCNDTSALNGHPGNSVASPEGKKALSYRQQADRITKDFAEATAAGKTPICAQSEDLARYCVNLCNWSGVCSDELVDSLGL
jgi:hypothetical protein